MNGDFSHCRSWLSPLRSPRQNHTCEIAIGSVKRTQTHVYARTYTFGDNKGTPGMEHQEGLNDLSVTSGDSFSEDSAC